jgi:hypothetical protein
LYRFFGKYFQDNTPLNTIKEMYKQKIDLIISLILLEAEASINSGSIITIHDLIIFMKHYILIKPLENILSQHTYFELPAKLHIPMSPANVQKKQSHLSPLPPVRKEKRLLKQSHISPLPPVPKEAQDHEMQLPLVPKEAQDHEMQLPLVPTATEVSKINKNSKTSQNIDSFYSKLKAIYNNISSNNYLYQFLVYFKPELLVDDVINFLRDKKYLPQYINDLDDTLADDVTIKDLNSKLLYSKNRI